MEDDNGKLWVEVIIFTFLDTAATVDFLTASYNDVGKNGLNAEVHATRI